jgi:hypothetical protein
MNWREEIEIIIIVIIYKVSTDYIRQDDDFNSNKSVPVPNSYQLLLVVWKQRFGTSLTLRAYCPGILVPSTRGVQLEWAPGSIWAYWETRKSNRAGPDSDPSAHWQLFRAKRWFLFKIMTDEDYHTPAWSTSWLRRSTLRKPIYGGGFNSWLRHYATSRKVAATIPDEVIGFFNWPNPSSRTMALGSTQPLTQMSTRNFPGDEGRPARGTAKLTAICEWIVYKMWEPRRLTTLWAFTVCCRDSFSFYLNRL